ncbi:DUF6879 family protein [Nocardiopsis tropica]|uniref:DUF6879 family protein n=1 Tax=Nocardiopsis tropica TaxID=109330 RepID=A0ABV1ZQA3_9ACTN
MPSLTNAGFDELFDGTTKSVFRLETLPVYNPVSEASSLKSYLAGDPCRG